MKVVLLSTRRLPPAYFDTVRADLGGSPELGLNVVGWLPPSGPVAGLVESFTLVGPGRIPVETPPAAAPTDSGTTPAAAAEAVPAPVSEAAKAPAPEAVTEETEAASEVAVEADADADAAAEAEAEVAVEPEPVAAPAPPAAPAKPRPTGARRVVKAVQWRYRRLRRAGAKVLPKAIKKSAPVRKLRASRRSDNLAKTYWAKVQGRPDVLRVIEQADVVIALDAGSIWAGWQLGRRRADTPVVLGLPAARRELDRLVGAGHG